MEIWSDLPVREMFRIKYFLDTNILAYLIDKTYSGLTQTITYLKDSEFADLVSSNYVIFEFVGIRKREHYLRKVLDKSTSPNGNVNISSLLKYKDSFKAPEVSFEEVKEEIKQNVEDEVSQIANNFNIDYTTNILHEKLLPPTIDLNLSSLISKEDSLVLTSAIWLDNTTKENFVVIISNDEQFCNSYETEILIPVFKIHELTPPVVIHSKNLSLQTGSKIDLTNPGDDSRLNEFLPSKLIELIIEKNKLFFLGKTINCGKSDKFPKDVVCFNLLKETNLDNNLYLTIIGKELDFIYSTKLPIEIFWNQTEISTYPFKSTSPVNISFRPMEDSSGTPKTLPNTIIDRLRETGNLVFINPD